MFFIKNLNYRHGDFHLRAQALELPLSGISLIRGPSGSGKSTFLRILLGLEEQAEVQWEFKGQSMESLPLTQRDLGMVFQNLELFPHMTALQNVKFAADCKGLSKEEFNKRCDDLSQKLDIDFWSKSVLQLSGGQRQRIALARALIQRPRIVFLDEPFSSLDRPLRAESRSLVKKLSVDYNQTMVLVSHDVEDELLADAIFEIQEGQIVKVR